MHPPQRGYALLIVIATLALVAFIAGRFAQRIDSLRAQTGQLQAEARGNIEADSARAAALYWVLAHSPGPNGFGDGAAAHWPADGRWVKLETGGAAQLQDPRGLLSVNVIEPEALSRLLMQAGAEASTVPRLIDSLEDYTDLDSLRRLNGAERPQYQEASLPGPRNDWMLSIGELCQIPAWSEQGRLCEKVAPWLSTRRGAEFNPNTAPAEVLRAQLPQALPGQVERLLGLRSPRGLASNAEVEAVSGLSFQRIEPIFWVGNTLRLTVWGRGQPRATEYNLILTPEGPRAPWLITEVHRVARPDTAELSRHSIAFAQPASPASAAPFAQLQTAPAVRDFRSSP